MYLKSICFSGGDPRELQEVFRGIRGIESTYVGEIYADDDVVKGLRILYNPKKTDLSTLMDILFTVVTPHRPDGQGNARGKQYRAGVWYEDAEDLPQLQLYMNFLANRGRAPAVTHARLTINDPNGNARTRLHCYARAYSMQQFRAAPEEQQNYYKAAHYDEAFIDFAMFRDCLHN